MKKKLFISAALLLFFSILSSGNLENLCRIYPQYGFDNQALLLWKYSASIGLLPYKDIFYPYGLLSYYSGQNIYFALLYLFITPVLFMGFYLTFQKIFGDKRFTYFSLIGLFLFVTTITGFETFTRYGSLAASAVLMAYIFYKSKKKTPKVIFLLGSMTGLLFPLINDFGFYAPVLFVVLAVADIVIRNRFRIRIQNIAVVIKQVSIYIFGLFIGLIPFLLYLFSNNIFIDFILFLSNLRDIAAYAKTPYFHSLFTMDNIFTLSVLMTAIIFICYKFFLGNKRATFNIYVQIALVTLLILLEQKSILRTIDAQITFIGFILFISLIYELNVELKKHNMSKTFSFCYFIIISLIIIFVAGLRPVDSFVNQYPHPGRLFTAIEEFKNKTCIENQTRIISKRNPEFVAVINELKKVPDFNGKVMTFPGEPIFYILLNQIPPYYPTIYEATPVKAQENQIRYIQDHNIDIILYNSKIVSIQDNVPDVVRGRVLYNYLRTRYTPITRVNDYVILKRNNKVDEDFTVDDKFKY